MLGVLKVTQDNKKMVWKYIPLQDLDALPYAKDGTLEQMLDELYSESE